MMNKLRSNIPNLLLLIKPKHFGFNSETAHSNHFQNNTTIHDQSQAVENSFQSVLADFDANAIPYKVFEDQEEALPDVVFSNNWISSDPQGRVTLYPMFTPNRRKEVRMDIADWVMERVKGTELIDLTNEVAHQRFLEGTGSIIFDHFSKTAFACESVRTDMKLFESHCEGLGYRTVSFESLDLKGNPIYHTNVMLSIAEKYCIINLYSIQNQLEKSFCKVTLEKAGKEVITISYAQMNAFAANVLEVKNANGESCLIMSQSAYKSLDSSQIARIEKYSKIVAVDVAVFEKIGGGGIRCMLTGLYV
ncbi:MAG: amidinotransferase [Crocinitomix sp.]|nr:amidinotransferase [Crocinitomix sp.]